MFNYSVHPKKNRPKAISLKLTEINYKNLLKLKELTGLNWNEFLEGILEEYIEVNASPETVKEINISS